jgi:hypothetical protein
MSRTYGGEQSGVLFATLNMPGGSNNDTDPWYRTPAMTASQAAEVTARTAADKRWLNTAFKLAVADGVRGVVIQLRADMWNFDSAAAGHVSEYKQVIDSIAFNTLAFGKPVRLFNGETHLYRSENPLVAGATCITEPVAGGAAAPCTRTSVAAACSNVDPYLNQAGGYNVPNFHRVTVHGSTMPSEWLKLGIDPDANAANGTDSFGPFNWKRIKP